MKHKCADCGFLAVRNNDTRQLNEVERNDDGSIAFGYIRNGTKIVAEFYPTHEPPLCFARAFNLWAEYRTEPMEPSPDNNERNRIRKVLERERDCEYFTEWQQGFTPKEHREMMDRERRQEWESKQEHYLVKMAGIFAIVAGIVGAGIGAFITWLLTRGGH